MSEGRDTRLMANATGKNVQAMMKELHEQLQQENADFQRQNAELSNGEALLLIDALITKAVEL